MKNSRLIALSAIAAAFSIIFMSLGAFIPALDYSGIFMASLCVMLPLAKKSYKAGLMTYAATLCLSAILIGATTARWELIVVYGLFFGLHPTINYIFREKNFNKILATVIKIVWFIGVMILIYNVFTDFLFDASFLQKEWVKKYIYLIIVVGGGALFIVYDLLMIRFQRAVDVLTERMKF